MAFTKPDQIFEIRSPFFGIRSPFFGIRSPFLEFVRIRIEFQKKGKRIWAFIFYLNEFPKINKQIVQESGLPPAFSEKKAI